MLDPFARVMHPVPPYVPQKVRFCHCGFPAYVGQPHKDCRRARARERHRHHRAEAVMRFGAAKNNLTKKED